MAIPVIKILAVEDDVRDGETLAGVVKQLGYALAGVANNALTALELLERLLPDVLLIDVDIKGYVNGVELAITISNVRSIPIVFATTRDKQELLNLSRIPSNAIVMKPYDVATLAAAIEQSIFSDIVANATVIQPQAMGDTLFIKADNVVAKMRLRDIVMVEVNVDENYCNLITDEQRHTVRMPLSVLVDRLPHEDFIQVHNAFVIRKSAIQYLNVGDQTVKVVDKDVPIGRTYRETVLTTLNLLS